MGKVHAQQGETSIFITPGYRFHAVGLLDIVHTERNATPLTVGIDNLTVEVLPLPTGDYLHQIAIRDIYNNRRAGSNV